MSTETIFATDLLKTENIDVSELSKESVFVVPIDYDFSSENWAEMLDGGGWESVDAVECESCGAVYAVAGFSAECDNEECERHGETIAEDIGPMMNYYYPLEAYPGDEGVCQLVHLPLCAVKIDDRWGLALTGGGMDLSWEICEAFMRLGLLPPLHFAGLPAMAGRGEDATDRKIAAACIETAKVARDLTANRAECAIREIEGALAFARRER